jgi:integrase
VACWFGQDTTAQADVRRRASANQDHDSTDDEAVRRRRASANRTLTVLRAALNRAFRNGAVTSDAAWRRLKPFKGVDKARVRYLDVDEAKRFLAACDPNFRPLAQAALTTGCRLGELCRLEVQDFNATAGTVHVRRSKSGKARHVVLNEEGAAFFTQLCAGRPGHEIMLRRADGSQWGRNYQQTPTARACARAGIVPPISFHALRHSWASLSVMAGVPLMIVARNLGHSTTLMVERHYGHLAQSYVADEIRRGAPKFGFAS